MPSMASGSWAATFLVLLAHIILAAGDACAAFDGHDGLCIWYPEDVVNRFFSCRESVFHETDYLDFTSLISDPDVAGVCQNWITRVGRAVNDPIWQSNERYGMPAHDFNPILFPENSEHTDTDTGPETEPTPVQVARHGSRHWVSHDTRCNPHNKTQIQVSDNGWQVVYHCRLTNSCFDISRTGMSARAGCDNGDGHYDVPDPHYWHPNPSKRGLHNDNVIADDPLKFDSRCYPDPDHANEIQRFNGTDWVYEYECLPSEPCIDMAGVGACALGKGMYYIPAAKQPLPQLLKRKNRLNPPPPEKTLHYWDTRCNPKNFTEVQRFHDDHWVLHSVCLLEGSCKDVNGIGACWVGGHHYLLPAANETLEDNEVYDSGPFLEKKRCDPKDNSIVQSWGLKGWTSYGVCYSPTICHDFSNAGFAICADPSVINSSVWMPWKPSNSSATPDVQTAVTKCKDDHEVLRLEGQDWIHDSKCEDGWECRTAGIPPHTSGCYSSSIAHLNVYKSFMQTGTLNASILARADSTSSILSDSSSDDDKAAPPSYAQKRDMFPPFEPIPKNAGIHARRLSSVPRSPIPLDDSDCLDHHRETGTWEEMSH